MGERVSQLRGVVYQCRFEDAVGEGAVKSISRPETEEMVVMLPFDFSGWGSAALMRVTVLRRSVWYAVCQEDGSLAVEMEETLETMTSMCCLIEMSFTHFSSWEGTETSAAVPTHMPRGKLEK
jgi:hypothetical protein